MGVEVPPAGLIDIVGGLNVGGQIHQRIFGGKDVDVVIVDMGQIRRVV